MPTHWTYEPFESASDLEQGDILQPSSGLKAIFKEVHKHFLDDKYVAFLIATQSCDLVRRNGVAKALYISLAAVRPLHQIVQKLIAQISTPVLPGVFRSSDKRRAKELLDRIFNQNEQALGLFFLYQDADAGIGEPSVAFLRVTVSVRQEHYEALQQARVGRLNPEYRAKLGWLLGNLYARPATRDWEERLESRQTYRRLVSQYVEEQVPGQGPRWVDDEIVQVAAARGLKLEDADPEELEALRPKPPHERSLDEIRAELMRVAPEIQADKLEKLTNRLRNNGKFRRLFSYGSETG